MRHVVVLTASLGLALAACGSSNANSDGGAQTTTVSLRSDVVPVLVGNCATGSTCHGIADGANVFLAAPLASASSTRALLVNQPSLELPSMPYVTPGDPANSFLVHKVDGDLASVAGCASGACGVQMPKDAPALESSALQTIRSWVEQGAKDN